MIRVLASEGFDGLIDAPAWLQSAVNWINSKRFVEDEIELRVYAPEYSSFVVDGNEAPSLMGVNEGNADSAMIHLSTMTDFVDEDGTELTERDGQEAVIHTLLHEYGHWVQYVRDGYQTGGGWKHWSEYADESEYENEPWEVFAGAFADENIEECLSWCAERCLRL
jgi:hypothetical protein